MMNLLARLLLCSSLVSLIAPSQAEEPRRPKVITPAPEDQKTVSKSKQFTVKGGDGKTRGAIASVAEGLRIKLDKLLDLEEGSWKSPITIRLVGDITDERPPFPFKYDIVTEPRLYDLRAHVGQGIQLSKLEGQILQLILFELGLRDIPDEELSEGMKIPSWLVEGLLEAMRFRSEEIDRKVYQRLYEQGALMTVDQLLLINQPQKLDLARQQIFRASSGALVLALLSQEGGKSGLQDTARSLALDPDNPRATLQRRFPGLNLGKKSLEKWWALQLATMATPLAFDSMSIAETDARLAKILTFQLSNDEGDTRRFDVKTLIEAKSFPGHERAFIEAQQHLSHLTYRCFPDYRPIILDYAQILNELNQGKAKKIEERLTNLRAERDIMLSLSNRARDYLDWYEITQSKARVGNFKQFLQAMEKLRNQPKKRQDPISTYLDVIEHFHHSKAGN